MATIETVTGPVDAAELGTTLIHEHLRTRDEAVHEQWPQAKASGGIPEREHPGDGHEAAIEVATAAVELGVRTICDPTAMFLGRDVAFMREVSEQTGLQVVAVHRHLHLRPPAAVLRQPRRRRRSPTCSSPTSSRGSRGPRSRPRSSSAPPTSPA